jgi:dephospho-CoA kinase
LASRPGSVKASLTGGVASGKSVLAELLAAFGAERLDFDDLCRRVVAKGAPGLVEVERLFGPKIMTPDGEMDRGKVAKIVFKDKEARKALEAIIHPAAWDLMMLDLKALAQRPLVVVEVPLLFEAALDSLFSPVILSFVKERTQKARLRARDGLSRWEAARRLAAQIPMAEKIRRADIVIDNDGSLTKTIRQAKSLWDFLAGPDFKPAAAKPRETAR